jgi:omega-hydroxy-beta-dihydromenaquinone-9 sulfotransferase
MKAPFDHHYYLAVDEQPLAGTTLPNWVKVLLENRFKIDWQFLPKALYVTIMIIAIAPLRFLERRQYDEQIKKTKVVKPVFIIGHWRSGTTFLHYLMGQDKSLGYVSTADTLDPSIFLRYEKILDNIVDKSLPKKRPMDNLEMKYNLPYEEEYAIANLSPYSFHHGWYFPRNIDRYFTRYVLFNDVDPKVVEEWKQTYLYFLQKITVKYRGKQIMLKSLVNSAKIKLLLELFPDAKFIHLMRNPYDVYLSTLDLYKGILPLFSFQHIDPEKFDRAIIDIYKGLYTRFLEEKHLIPKENLIEIRYEDFIKDPMKTLETIYADLDLKGFKKSKPAFQRYLDRHANYKRNERKIDDQTKEKIYSEWKFAFKAFGYKK